MTASTRKKTGLRRPPAFQRYVSDDLARADCYPVDAGGARTAWIADTIAVDRGQRGVKS